jgi:hypothetical protein
MPLPASPFVIEFSWDDSTRYRLDIDKVDHTVFDLKVLSPDPLVGDDETTIEYLGQQIVGGLPFPKRATSWLRCEKYLDLELSEIRVDGSIDPAKFEVPAGFVENPSKPVATARIDANLYEVSSDSDALRPSRIDSERRNAPPCAAAAIPRCHWRQARYRW